MHSFWEPGTVSEQNAAPTSEICMCFYLSEHLLFSVVYKVCLGHFSSMENLIFSTV